MVLRFYFLFLTLDHEEKLNDTLNIQTGTIIIIKQYLSSNFSDFISVFSKQTNTIIPKEKYFMNKCHETSSINKIK